MSINYSQKLRVNYARLSADEPVLILVEIRNPYLLEPIYLVQDSVDIISNGNTYLAVPMAFQTIYDEYDRTPEATIRISNIGRTLMRFIEQSNGGLNSIIDIKQIRRCEPDLVERSISLEAIDLTADIRYITIKLAIHQLFLKKFVRIAYTAENYPGLF